MRRLLILAFILTTVPMSISAQRELDFASKFMEINGNLYEELTCKTVSPFMMERIMKLDTLEDNKEMRKVLAQLKSIQIVKAQGSSLGDTLFNKATELAQLNKRRYKLYADDEDRQIYLRKRNKIIVEMVFIANMDNVFNIVNLTGNMDESFLKELTNM